MKCTLPFIPIISMLRPESMLPTKASFKKLMIILDKWHFLKKEKLEKFFRMI